MMRRNCFYLLWPSGRNPCFRRQIFLLLPLLLPTWPSQIHAQLTTGREGGCEGGDRLSGSLLRMWWEAEPEEAKGRRSGEETGSSKEWGQRVQHWWCKESQVQESATHRSRLRGWSRDGQVGPQRVMLWVTESRTSLPRGLEFIPGKQRHSKNGQSMSVRAMSVTGFVGLDLEGHP